MPIEKNTEMRSLKNLLIRTALSMNFNAQTTVNNVRIGFLFSMLAKQIVNSAGKRLDEFNKMMPLTDSKDREKIRDKKLAHGQKEGSDSNGIDNEVYDSHAAEGILTMLDYLIIPIRLIHLITKHIGLVTCAFYTAITAILLIIFVFKK